MKMVQKILSSYYNLLIPFGIILVIHIFSAPTYFALSPECKPCPECCDMQGKIDRKDHLLESVSNQFAPASHMAKTEFRLTIPFLAYMLHIDSKTGIYILQVLAGWVFFLFLTRIIYQIIPDRTITFLAVLGFAFIYPGFSFVAEMEGFFDSFAFLFLLIAMADIPIVFIGLALFLAFWTDERSIFSGILIVFWWQYKQFYNSKKSFFLPSVATCIYALTLILYIILRWYLVTYLGFVNQLKGTGTIFYTIDYTGLASWQAFEGFWLVIVLASYTLFIRKQYVVLFIWLLINLGIFVVGMNVMDITRSVAYIFPSILVAFFVIKDQFDYKQVKQITLIAAIFCFLYPAYSFIATKPPHAYHPVYMRLAKKLLHIP